MDPQQAQAVAVQILALLPPWITSPWWAVLVALVVTAVGGAVGVFAKEYLAGRGKMAATKADFQSILEQLEQTTLAVEEIKSGVSHDDWLRREKNSLLRSKLEVIGSSILEHHRFMLELRNLAIEGKTELKPWPIENADILVKLYFPEMAERVHVLNEATLAILKEVSENSRRPISQRGNIDEDNYRAYLRARSALIADLRAKVVELL